MGMIPQQLPFESTPQGPASFILGESYYNQVHLPPSSGPWGVAPSHGPWPVTSTHVYQAGPGSQMGMIPQQLPFESTPQGPAYFIPGQYCLPPMYVVKPSNTPFQQEPRASTEAPAPLSMIPSEASCSSDRFRETTPAPEPQRPAASPPAPEEVDLTLEDKEEKLDAEDIQPDSPQPSTIDKEFQYKEEQWNPVNPEEKKKNDREFILSVPAINDVVRDKNVDFTLGDKTERSVTKELSAAELSGQLDKLHQDKADNQKIIDWAEANLDEQKNSNMFIRVLMTCVCQAAIIYLLRMYFQYLYDEDVITEEAFFMWESSRDAAEQQGKDVALKSVTTFFMWLHESDNSS